jgi:hypothetical protein
VCAGAAGTATLTLAYAAERRLRRNRHGPLDFDDSLVPGQIVASVMHLPHVTAREDRELGLMLRWSYGSAFGLLHGALHRRVPEPWASAVFGATLMSATLSLFPLLGHTPAPWRWPADVMATSVGTHVAYGRVSRSSFLRFRGFRPVWVRSAIRRRVGIGSVPGRRRRNGFA